MLALVVVIVGIALRIHGLDSQSLWYDEIWSVFVSRGQSFAEIAAAMRVKDVHPPAYQFLLAVVMRFFGDSPIIVRMPSVIAGSLAVYALFRLGQLLYGVRTGLFASAILAVSSTSIFYSQETRSYAWLLCLSIASSYYFVRVFLPDARGGRARPGASLLYCLLATALVYTHYYGVLVVVTHGLVAIVRGIRDRSCRSRLILFVAVGLAYLPWLPAMLEHLQIKAFWIVRPTARHLVDYLAFAFNGQITVAAAAVVLCFLAALLTALKRRKVEDAKTAEPADCRSRWATAWLVLWVVLPISLAYGKSLVSTPIFTYRNLIICFPPLFLLTAHSLSVLIAALMPISRKPRSAVAGCFAILAAGILMLVHLDFYSLPNRPQYREAVQAILDSGVPLEQVSVITTDEAFDYYLERMTPGLPVVAIAYADEHYADVSAALAARQTPYVWYLQGFTRTGRNDVREKLEADYLLVLRRHFVAAEASLFKSKQ